MSVESVSADVNSPLEAQITADYQDATALEMEGYGVMYAALNEETPCVVVRGISDDRAGKDPALDKIHQPVAAAHAAAFAYELLNLWGENRRPPDTRTLVSRPTSEAPILSSAPSPNAGGPVRTSEINAEHVEKPPQILADKRRILVLDLAGEQADYPPEKQQEVLDAVRKVTGNPAIEIVGSKAGSFHLFIKAEYSDLAKLRSPKPSLCFGRNAALT